jgi:hypothetical protein
MLGIGLGFFPGRLIGGTAEWKMIVTTASVLIALQRLGRSGCGLWSYPAVKASRINLIDLRCE